jgi:hypothetical protein
VLHDTLAEFALDQHDNAAVVIDVDRIEASIARGASQRWASPWIVVVSRIREEKPKDKESIVTKIAVLEVPQPS